MKKEGRKRKRKRGMKKGEDERGRGMEMLYKRREE